MKSVIKPWNDGGSLSVTYDGDRDGSAVFSSDPYEGIDREQPVIFRDSNSTIAVEKVVRQEGIRQQLVTADGKVFRLKNGGRFGVLREKAVEPPAPEPVKPYTEVEYIESTGTQWIDTGVALTSKNSVELDYQFTSKQHSTLFAGLFGGLSSTMNRFGTIVVPNTQYLEHGYGTNNDNWKSGLSDTNRHLLKYDKNKIYFDGNLVHTFQEGTFDVVASAPLGNFAYANCTPAIAKYYSSRWWDDNVLVRDFIPVIDLNGIACLYDKVSEIFFYNQGTGDFIAGNIIE